MQPLDKTEYKSLEDIIIERTGSHIERGTNGITREVSRKYKQKLTVRTIGSGLRFVHLIVDYFVIMILIQILGYIGRHNPLLGLFLSIIILCSYPLFYAVMEYYFQQTPGKMITGYVVIDKYANKPGFGTCLLRALIRLVPFSGFSCLDTPSRGWHDRWTSTYVVKKEEVQKLKKILDRENNIVVEPAV